MYFTVISQTDVQPIIETNFSKDNKCIFLIRQRVLIKYQAIPVLKEKGQAENLYNKTSVP